MSWNFSITIDGHQIQDMETNYTYNVSPLFYDAFDGDDGIRGLNGMSCKDCFLHIRRAIVRLKSAPDKYTPMVAGGGEWGTYEGAIKLLATLRDWCSAVPTGTLLVE